MEDSSGQAALALCARLEGQASDVNDIRYSYWTTDAFLCQPVAKISSTGRDLAIFCGYTHEIWTPEALAKGGCGGSEEAIILLATGLARKGWNVVVYNNCGEQSGIYEGVTYKPYTSWDYRDRQDVVILWREVRPLDWDINASRVYVDIHDMISPVTLTRARVSRARKFCFKSGWHRNLYAHIGEQQVAIIPNGIIREQFAPSSVLARARDEGRLMKRNSMLIINTASPPRALSALIQIMRDVHRSVPSARMQWAYGWSVNDLGLAGNAGYANWKQRVVNGMKETGIEDMGRLDSDAVAKLYLTSNLYIYPTRFPEIDCISISKALAGGAIPIATRFGAIREKARHGGQFIEYEDLYEDVKNSEFVDFSVQSPEILRQFADRIVRVLMEPMSEDERDIMRHSAIEAYAWDVVISQWHEMLSN